MNFDFTRIDVLDFLERLGMRNIQDKGTEIFYSCPFPGHSNEDNNPSASMKQGTTVAYCFTCGWKGNALRFLSDFEGVSPLVAIRWLRQEYGDDFKEPKTSLSDELEEIWNRKKDEVPSIKILDMNEVERRDIVWKFVEDAWMRDSEAGYPFNYMLDRGFSVDILEEFHVGWDGMSQRITIPYFLPTGELIGFKARTPLAEEFPRYLVLGGAEYGFKPFSVGDTVFGANLALQSHDYKVRKHLYVCEGELNCIAMHDQGYDNTVGISGKYLSVKQTMQIVEYASSATFIFDEVEDSLKAAVKLQPYMPVAVAPEHSCDPAEASEDYLYELLQACVSPLMCRMPTAV